jgi:protoheme IX farnesyltransferase
VLADYVSLTKPGIIALLDATAVVIGGSLAAGGAHAVNCWYERDIDAIMTRTSLRPIPAGRIPGWHAVLMGVAFNLAAFAVLWAWADLLAAGLTLLASAIYVFVYTMWLKRSTSQNIVIGGAAGAIPTAGRLGRGDRLAGLDSALALPAGLLLDSAPFLGACAARPARL